MGKSIAHYEIGERLGQGGMGVVYRARDPRLDRLVALKVLPPERVADPERKRRFIRDAKAASALNHPNIAHIFEISSADGIDYIAMELVEGKTLTGLIGERGLRADVVVKYGVQVADALAKSHAAGIVHRDLKPSNIMVTEAGVVKVLDFGLGRLSERTGRRAADARSDIYSLGALLSAMTAGNTAAAPAGLRNVIGRCMAKDPAQRYQKAAEVRAALEAIAGTSTEPADTRSRLHATAVSRGLAGRRKWLAGIAAILLAAFGAWWVSGRSRPPELTGQRLLSTFAGEHRSGSFSPDGSMVAFLNAVNGVPQVWIKNLAQGDPVPITSGAVPAAQPRWSPKNDQIVYGRLGQGIWSVAPSGAPPRRIIGDGRNANFSGDGELLVFERGKEIWVAKSDGTDAHRVEGVPGNSATDSFPALSPDGRWIVFFRAENGPAGDLWVIPAAGGEARQLTTVKAAGSGPVWTPDGRWIICSFGAAGVVRLWRVPAAGGAPEPLTTGAGDDTAPALSADGRQLIFTNARKGWVLLLLDLDTLRQQELVERREGILFPTFSPAGDRIAFFHSVGSDVHIFTVAVNGANVRQITRGKGETNTMPRWSADGAFLYFYRMKPTPSFRKIPANRGADSEIAPWSWDDHNGAQEDPTGRFLAYTLCEHRNCSATMVRELSTGQERRLALTLHDPRWSPDGVTVMGPQENREIAICPASGQACTSLTRGESPVWDPSGAKIYFMRVRASREQFFDLFSLDLKTRSEQQLASLGPFLLTQAFFDASRSRQIVTAVFRQTRPELWLADIRR